MSLRNMNIAPRALLGFALIGLLMLGLGVFSLIQMGNIRQAGVAIEQVSVPSIKILDELTALNLRMRTLSYRLLLNREPETQRDTLNLLDQRNSQIDRARQALPAHDHRCRRTGRVRPVWPVAQPVPPAGVAHAHPEPGRPPGRTARPAEP
ncbi:MCP four helix bundle domain-containing protein [Pseudomonas monteilii]|uniref:MCP four helix bundle domain-containing protein n=1 Tax=Pseudomonas monteilii TaxID=76759 RepID=UPI00398B2B61